MAARDQDAALGLPALRACALAILVAIAACRSAPPLNEQRVSIRLGAQYFGADGTVRPAVVEMQHEAREILGRRQWVSLATKAGLPFTDGRARLPAVLPDSVRGFPASAFVLGVRRLPASLSSSQLEALAKSGAAFARMRGGWELVRDPADPSRATASLPADLPSDQSMVVNMRLDAFEPTPSVLESTRFDVTAGSHLEFGYGLGNPSGGAAGTHVGFGASLHCASGTAFDAEVGAIDIGGAADDKAWHDATATIGSPASDCRLRLTISSTGDPGDPVWATPRLLAPVAATEHFDPRNLVLISLDTLRADHLSSYGYARPTSPSIDRLMAAAGITFTDVSTTYPSTDIAHLSLFTGLYPAAQPVLGSLPRSAAARTLTEALRDAGFETAAFTEDAYVGAAYGFAFGFDRFRERPEPPYKRARETFADGVRYLQEHQARKFFLFLHTYQIHGPYEPSEAYRSFFRDDQGRGSVGVDVPAVHRAEFDDYDRGIRETDDIVAGFLAELDRLGLGQRTYVVVLADHGEAFGEHVVTGHGFGANQEELHVPWIVRGPGIAAGRQITVPASLVDVTPTLLALLGVPPLDQVQGVSLLPLLQHPGGAAPPPRPLFFEWNQPAARGVRLDHWKLMETAGSELLFDLVADPRERAPITTAVAAQKTTREALASYSARAGQPRQATPEHEPAVVPEDTQRALRALGYVQ